MSSKKLVLIIVVIAVLAALGAGFWYWSQKGAEVSEIPIPTETPAETAEAVEVKDGVGAEAFEKSNNPLSNELPETNPFKVNTNPFK